MLYPFLSLPHQLPLATPACQMAEAGLLSPFLQLRRWCGPSQGLSHVMHVLN